MSTRMVCDICGRVIDGGESVRLVVDPWPEGKSTTFDLCMARNGNDVGCNQFVPFAIRTMKEMAQARR